MSLTERAAPVSAPTSDRWLAPGLAPGAGVTMFCFPHAGGGPGFFGPWRRPLRSWLDVRPVHLPGRESRGREEPLMTVEEAVPPAAAAIEATVDRPFLLFGHSLGSILAFEVARVLEGRGMRPAGLVVSSRGAPELQPRAPRYELMDRPAFLAAVEQLNGTPAAVLEHEGLVDMMLPIMRADFLMNERYVRFPGAPLRAPILALAAESDPEVPVADMLAWRHESTGGFTLRVLDGDHFHLKSAPQPVWGAIRSLLHERGFNSAQT